MCWRYARFARGAILVSVQPFFASGAEVGAGPRPLRLCSRSLAARHRLARQPRRRRPARRRQRARPWPPRRSRCAALRSLSEHILQAAAAFSRGAATTIQQLCTWAVHVASRLRAIRLFLLRRRCIRQGLAAPRAMLADVLLLCAAAGSLRASMLCSLLCVLHLLCLLSWLIFALSPNSFSRSLSLLSCLACSQRRGHLQCAT